MKDIVNDIKINVIKKDKADNKRDVYGDKRDKLEEYLSEKNSAGDNPVFIPTESQYKPSGLMKFLGYAAKIAIIFTLGGFGGVWLEHSVIPVIATKAPFDRYDFFKQIKDRTVIINRTEEIKISEDAFALDMVRKTSPVVVKITANYNFQEKPARVKRNAVPLEVAETRNLNGVIITSDGLILTIDPRVFTTDLAKFDLKNVSYKVAYGDKEFTVSDANDIKPYDFKIKSSDPREKSVLLKIKSANLPVIAMAGVMSNVEIGQRAFALGNTLFSGLISEIRTEDGVKLISVDNAPSGNYFGGGPLVNIKGELLGINIFDLQGKPASRFISIDNLKDFINSAIGA